MSPSIASIKAHVCRHFGVPQRIMAGPQKERLSARPRQVAMYLARELTPSSLPFIGREFRRDHTTVIHAIRQIERLRSSDPAIDADVRALEKELAA